jgi:hypothetical protein
MRPLGSSIQSLIVYAFILLPAALLAQSPSEPVAPEVMIREVNGRANVRALRLPSPLQFDGRLEEPHYRDTKSFGEFIQQEPHEGQPASDKTEGWLFFDDDHIYVAVRLWETDSSKRVMSDMRRDAFNLYNNDHVAILFDTFHDHRNGFGFSSNAQGGLFDWQTTNEQPSPNWNGLWEARTANFDGGWTVEFRIPFRSIRFAEGGHVWGINVRRMVRWKNEVSYLSPVPVAWGRRGLNKLSDAGSLVGLDVPIKLRNLDVKPYALGAVTTNRLASPPINDATDIDLGVDAKWGITQSLVADLTYHTDFAQVEDDEGQVNLTRFSVLFPEKRDFFLEGQDVFLFGGANPNQGGGLQAIQGGGQGGGAVNNLTPFLFFSRRIGLQNNSVIPIDGGARLIGRTGAFQIGALHMHTARKALAGAQPTDFSVLRVNRDILSRSRVGMIATRRGPALGFGGDNYAFGGDASFNPKSELQINAYWSATRQSGTRPSSKREDEQSYRGQFNWNADATGFQVEHLYVGDGFDPQVGFLRRSAFRRTYGLGRYSPRPQSWKGVRKIYFEASLDYFENPGGHPESREAQGAYRMELNNSDQFAFEYSNQYEAIGVVFPVTPGLVVPPGEYEFTQGKFLYTSSPQRPVSGTLVVTRGGFYGGTLNEFTWRGRVELGPQFQVEPAISLNYFDTPWGTGDAHLISSRVTYTVTPRMFVSALVQYQSSLQTVTTNARFRWEYSPGSELFIVYSDGRNTLIGRFPPPLETRSFVVKLTKLFRL